MFLPFVEMFPLFDCSPDVPQIVLLTHVDEVCHAVQEDVKYVYSSCIIKDKVAYQELLGLK